MKQIRLTEFKRDPIFSRYPLFAVALTILAASSVRSQTQVWIPTNVFPISGLTFNIGTDLSDSAMARARRAGLNYIYSAGGNAGASPTLSGGLRGIPTLNRFEDPRPALNNRTLLANYANEKSDDAELRFFMTSNETKLTRHSGIWNLDDSNFSPDLIYRWDSVIGDNITNNEWLVPDVQTLSGGYILKGLQSYFNDPGGHDERVILSNRTDSAHVSFVYRLRTADSANGLTPLFRIEYTLFFYNDATSLYDTMRASSDLRYSDFNTYISTAHPHENRRILFFPDTSSIYLGAREIGAPPLVRQKYAVASLSIPLNTIPGHRLLRIGCDVKKLVNVQIFIRGLRIRTDLAEKVLTDDSATVAEIHRLADSNKWDVQALGTMDRVDYFSSGHEPELQSYRTRAHIEQVVFKRIGKHNFPFIANNLWNNARYTWYRSIYEDETGNIPPPIGVEDLQYFDNWKTNIPYPADAIDYALRGRRDFTRVVVPLTGDTATESGSRIAMTYSVYTQRMQFHHDVRGTGTLTNAAQSAYPPYAGPGREGIQWSHVSMIQSLNPESSIKVTDTLRRHLLDTLRYSTNPDKCELGKIVYDFRDVFDSTPLAMGYRGPIPSEIRSQGWMSLCYGAKGLVFNPITSDGLNNNGSNALDSIRFNYDTTGAHATFGFWIGNCELGINGAVKNLLELPAEPLGTHNNSRFPDHLIKHPFGGFRLIPIIDPRNTSIGILEDTASINGYVRYAIDNLGDSSYFAGYRTGWTADSEGVGDDCMYTPGKHYVWAAQSRDIADHSGCYFWGMLRFTGLDSWTIKAGGPIYSGQEDRYEGAARVVKDIIPIAQLLHDLRWRNGISYQARFDTTALGPSWTTDANASWERYPIIEDTSHIGAIPIAQKVKPFVYPLRDTSLFDTPNSSYLQFGLFSHPTDSASYVIVLNRRTWPFRRDHDSILHYDQTMSGHAEPLLGAIDARQVNFKIRTSQFDPSWAYFSVTNMRTNEEQIRSRDSLFHITLEPGEGTLLRIAPARSYVVGRTSNTGMAYNNGHRLAELDSDRRIMTWESNGRIQYAVVNRPRIVSENSFVNPDSGQTLDSSAFALNPSVAYGFGSIGIIYNLSQNVTRIIRHGKGTPDTVVGRPVILATIRQDSLFGQRPWSRDTLAWVVSGTGDHIQRITPSIAPDSEGFVCAWSTPDSGVRVQIANTHAYITNRYSIQADPSAARKVFPTVATRYERVADSLHQRIHLAWEEDVDSTHSAIYYVPIVDTFGHANLYIGAIERVTKNAPSCEHHHPNIAVANTYKMAGIPGTVMLDTGQPIVTWEMRIQNTACDSALGPVYKGTTYVMLRQRGYGLWGGFDALYPRANNLPLPLVHTGIGAPNDPPPGPYLYVTFQDTAKREVHIEKLNITYNLDPEASPWVHTKLIDAGQYPNLSLPFIATMLGIPPDYTFRGIIPDSQSLYAARITSHRLGAEIPVNSQQIESFEAKDTSKCESGFRFTAGRGSVGCADCPEPYDPQGNTPDTPTVRSDIHWLYRDLTHSGASFIPLIGFPPAPPPGPNVPWPITEDTIRTNYFHIESTDVLRWKSSFTVHDSAGIVAAVNHPGGFIRYALGIKDSASGAWIKTLDSLKIWKTGTGVFVGMKNYEGPILFDPCQSMVMKKDSGINITSKTGYLTIQVMKDSNTSLDLVQTQAYIEDYDMNVAALEIPGAFKPAAPSPATATESALLLGVYPNPTSKDATVQVSLTSGLPATVDVLDILGRPIQRLYSGVPDNSAIVNLDMPSSSLPQGSYFVRASSGNQVSTVRLEVAR